MSRTARHHARQRSMRRASLALRYVVLGAWALFCLAPILWFLTIAFRDAVDVRTPVPVYWPEFSLDALSRLSDDWPTLTYLRNSVLAIIGSVLIDLVLGIPAAYSLARYRYRGRDDIGFYILSTRMMMPAIVVIPIVSLFQYFELINTIWALMLVFAALNLSIVTWILRSYMLDVPRELEDAARTDGASDLRILWSIIIPICLPGIVTAAAIASIFAINEFLLTLQLAQTEEAYTLSVALRFFTGGTGGIIYNLIATVAFLAFIPVFIIILLIQRHLSRGLSMGAVKG